MQATVFAPVELPLAARGLQALDIKVEDVSLLPIGHAMLFPAEGNSTACPPRGRQCTSSKAAASGDLYSALICRAQSLSLWGSVSEMQARAGGISPTGFPPTSSRMALFCFGRLDGRELDEIGQFVW